jgi:hypothetical protein
MATLNIIDTGWLNLVRSGTQATRANSGSAVVMPTASVNFQDEATVESSVLPGMIDTTAQPIGYARPVLSVTVLLRGDNAADQEILKDIYGVYGNTSYPGMHRTRGIKLLYITSTTDIRKTALELTGSTSLAFHGNEITAGLPAYPGYPYNVRMTDIPGGMIRLNFDFQVA